MNETSRRDSIKQALEENSHELHPPIVHYIQQRDDNYFIGKPAIYATLNAFIQGKAKVDMSGVEIPHNPNDILSYALEYVKDKRVGFPKKIHKKVK